MTFQSPLMRQLEEQATADAREAAAQLHGFYLRADLEEPGADEKQRRAERAALLRQVARDAREGR